MKKSINEEINRIKVIMKSLTEDDYNMYGLTKTPQGFRYDNYDDKDFSDDVIIHPEEKIKKDKPLTSFPKDKIPPKILTLDNQEDRIDIIKKMINGKKLKNLVDDKAFFEITRVYKRYSSDGYFNSTQKITPDQYVIPRNFVDTFDIEIIYFLLKNGTYKSIDRTDLSKTFNKLITKSEKCPKCSMFKENVNLSLNDFVNFMKKNYEKIMDEIGDEIRKIIDQKKKI